uniref:Uncharacterized protein n=1 Tax=Aegilops tauschii TaxID=37682 RepID=M8BUT6_AEGTA
MPTNPRRIRQTATDHFPYTWQRTRTKSRQSTSCSTAARTAPSYANGRTFLHVAVLEESQSVVTYACKLQSKKFSSSVMNMQDKDGNTALHLAIQMGNVWIFSPLMKNRKVKLNLRNNKGQTPLDLSWITTPAGVHYGLNPRIMIHKLLQDAGAKNGTFRCDHFHKEHIVMLDPKEEAQKITDSTQTIGIASVLIATVAFTAAFALPGGYRADDHPNGGTPTLARHYAFDVQPHRFLELPQAGASVGGEGGESRDGLPALGDWVYDYIVEFFQYKDILHARRLSTREVVEKTFWNSIKKQGDMPDYRLALKIARKTLMRFGSLAGLTRLPTLS